MRAAPKNVIFMHMPPLIVYFHLSLVIFACYLYLSILFYTMQENPFLFLCCRKFVIRNQHVRGDFSSESPNFTSAPHAAKYMQVSVLLGMTLISWGTIRTLRGTICLAKH